MAALAASSVACSTDVEPTGSATEAIIIHAPLHPAPLAPIQAACGVDVTQGGCVKGIAFDVYGAFPGSSVTVTGYFWEGSVVTVGGTPATVITDTTDANPTHLVFELPMLPAGVHVIAIESGGSAVRNESNNDPLVVSSLAPYVVDVSPHEIPAGQSATITVTGHGLFNGASYTIGHETGSLTNCFQQNAAIQCSAFAPYLDAGTYPVVINTCPSTGLCYSQPQSVLLTYALSCQDRYVTQNDGSVYDLNSGKTFSYKGQDTQQYCLADYGCASPSVDELKRFFAAFKQHCINAPALSAFPRTKVWSSSATRTGEDTYTAISFDPLTSATTSENGDTNHGCLCAR